MRPHACPRRPATPWTGIRRFLAIAMIVQQLSPPLALAALNRTGRWFPGPDLGFSGTHVAVLRKPGTDTTTVFMFGETGTPQSMKFWRFVPGDANPQWPTLANTLNLPHPNDRKSDLFCSGHATLPDGRLLLVGGAWMPEPICQHVYSLDPGWSFSQQDTTPWEQNAVMATERWYATATPLNDGRVLAVSGTMASVTTGFGGLYRTAAGEDTTYDKVRPLEQAGRYAWSDTTTIPANNVGPNHPTITHDDYTQGRWPRGREGHGFVADGSGRGVLLFGRSVGPVSGVQMLNDVWSLIGSKAGVDTIRAWHRFEPVGDVSLPVEEQFPVLRHRFAMTWAGVEQKPEGMLPGALDKQICYIHGGLDASGNVLGDLWKGERRNAIPSAPHYQWVWKRLLPDAPERRRFGHTMLFDPGPGAPTDSARLGQLVIYGGQTATSPPAFANTNKLYVVGVGKDSPVLGVWQEITPAEDPEYGYPTAVEGHAMTAILKGNHVKDREYYMFGGQDASGSLVAPDLWSLERADTALSNLNQYHWGRIEATSGGPPARTRAGMSFSVDGALISVIGGDTTGSAVPGGLANDIWTYPVTHYGGEHWRTPPMRSFHAPPPAVAGMPFLTAPVGGARETRSLERFRAETTSPAGQGCPTLAGQWETVTLQNDADSERRINPYSYTFQLPDGRLFHAGPAPGADLVKHRYRRFFDFATSRWQESDPAGVQDAARFGSAVMLRPGKLLRAGGYGEQDAATDKTETIDIGASTMPAWVPHVPAPGRKLVERQNHNLTLLPTGDVLASGGETNAGWELGGAVKFPQLWRTAESRWNDRSDPQDTLLADPNVRNYHSIAILLPDARVMTAGGEKGAILHPSETNTSIFEPPYLFRATGDYATRPRVLGAPPALTFGRTFTLTLTDPTRAAHIKAVSLMRPGAVTHSFDQNQRFVPLDFAVAQNPSRLLVKAPANGYLASPGDHMLFVVDEVASDAPRVPSIAYWTKTGATVTQVDPFDVTPPRGGNFFALHEVGCSNDPNSRVRLGWTAPADDDSSAYSGLATAYNLRYALNASAPAEFNLWTALSTAYPAALGSAETRLVDGLSINTWYRFALKAVGDNADTSSLSNIIIAKPTSCEGGGGGYEEGDGLVSGGPGALALTSVEGQAAAQTRENSLFPGAPLGSPARDLLRFPGTPRLLAGLRSAYIREGGARGLSLDRIRLLAADRPPGTESVADETGTILAGLRVPAISVRDRRGLDITAAATGAGVEPVYADSGEALLVTLPPAEPIGDVLLLQTSAASGNPAGIVVEREVPGGAWAVLGSVHPRRGDDVQAAQLAGATRIRLRFEEACLLRFVGRLTSVTTPSVTSAALLSAGSPRADWTSQARERDDESAIVPARDTLQLAFEDVPAAIGLERDWYLALEGTPLAPSFAAFLARQSTDEPGAVPAALALHQNVPNPFRASTLLRFDLPTPAHVRLEIFDAQGRRVWSRVASYPAGRHEVEWEFKSNQSRAAAPGIYTYRLLAGSRSLTRKLVVLP